jgi:exodeoxyribonuclease-5
MIAEEEKTVGKPFFTLNMDSEVKNCKLLIIDECSMIDGRMGEDLLSFGVKVLVLGDPAQLPPVKGAGFFTENVRPNVMLEEIHRQAEESPIIRMASMTRKGKALDVGDYGDGCEVIEKRKIDPEKVTEYDQYLVGRNVTRRSYNARMREILGHAQSDNPASRYPVAGDKIVCLRNNHDQGLLNGVLFRVDEVAGVMDEKVLFTATSEDGGDKQEILTHEHYFVGREEELSWFEKKEANEFDYGYALTVHKAQGSQWDRVFVTDESFCFRADKWKWLYTAITRAAKSVTVMRT